VAKQKSPLFSGIERKKPIDPELAEKFVSSNAETLPNPTIPTNTKTKKLTLELEVGLHRDFSIYCIKNDIKMSEFLREKIRETLGH